MGLRGFLSVALIASACWAAPASAQYIHLKDFPQIFGNYAPKGGCSHAPRVGVSAAGIRIEAAGKNTFYAKPDVMLGYGGQEDSNVTIALRGPDAGLTLSFTRDGSEVASYSGQQLTPEERAIDAVSGKASMLHCGAGGVSLAPPPPPPEPEAPKMRATAELSVDKLATQDVMTDPGFHAAYLAALGPVGQDYWLIEMDGPGEQKAVTVGGVRYLEVESCKPHDCGDNNMIVIYRPAPRALYGAIRRKGGAPVLIGNPPLPIAVQLKRLWTEAWVH
jgi:hypothetical protein